MKIIVSNNERTRNNEKIIQDLLENSKRTNLRTSLEEGMEVQDKGIKKPIQ